ncbi:TrkH family potassium uptake protein [Cohnella massiliensis]|uniref:TrkH family potassium uptake protein n=1 Tax=Cohnella massiliensis TaxID=1816691 RepID=UPI0009BB7610|nr:TrkH family potassium uptake protein [Cohnella massiliensis]
MYKKAVRWLYASPYRTLVFGFAFLIAVGAVLLKLPVSVVSGQTLSWIDAWFTSVSALCVTGLVVVDTGTHFSAFGHWVLLILIQVGGLGFMTMGTLFALMLRRKVSLRDRLALQESLNQNTLEGLVRLVRKVVLYALTIEAVGSLLYAIRFMEEMSLGRALYYGIFHGVSVFNNAGFDLFGDFRSMSDYVSDPYMNVISIILILCGSLGFVVLADLVEWPQRKRLSLHSKVVLSVTVLLFVGGAIVIFIFEYTNEKTFGPLNFGNQLLAALLHSATPRSAGVTTLNMYDMRQATQFFIVWLMFIGASPGSTGGGIKTTSFAVLVAAVYAVIRGKTDVVLFRHRLGQTQVYKAIMITFFSLAILVAATMILSVTENASFMGVLFEATSAFATVGLSMGLTTELSTAGKIIIMLVMFVGRVGPYTLSFALAARENRSLYRHAEGKIIIG